MAITSTPPRRPLPQAPVPQIPARPPGTTSALRAIAVGLGAILLASLLNAEALQDTARAQPFGWKRTAMLSLVRPLVSTSRALGLDRPRRLLDEIVHPSRYGPAPVVPTPAPTPTPTMPAPTPTATPPAAQRRRPTAAAPLRIWIGGDSMAQAFGQSLIKAASATGVARARLEVHISSGLTRPDFFDWPDRLRHLLGAASPPEAIVFMVGANDAQGIRTVHGSAPFGSTAWRAEYRSRVAAMMNLLAGQGRTVYWIGQPIMRSTTFSARMRILDDIYRREAARSGVRYIDPWALFSDADGRYAASLPDASGRWVLMRQSDGIHLTRAGAERLTKVVMAVIRADWELRSP